MAGGLNQISIRYLPQEDRLLLQFNTRDRKEYRLWLTRNLTANGLWPAIEKLLRADPKIRALADEEAKKAILSFQHEGMVDKGAFTKKFDDNASEFPLGEKPVLVVGVRAQALKEGDYAIALDLKKGGEAGLRFDVQLMHNFCKLLINAVNASTWDVRIGFDADRAEGTAAEHRVH